MGALEIIFEEGKAEGLAKGLAKGKAEGKAEGLVQGEARALVAILRKRGFALTPSIELRIAETSDARVLERWIDRAIEATTLEDVFAS